MKCVQSVIASDSKFHVFCIQQFIWMNVPYRFMHLWSYFNNILSNSIYLLVNAIYRIYCMLKYTYRSNSNRTIFDACDDLNENSCLHFYRHFVFCCFCVDIMDLLFVRYTIADSILLSHFHFVHHKKPTTDILTVTDNSDFLAGLSLYLFFSFIVSVFRFSFSLSSLLYCILFGRTKAKNCSYRWIWLLLYISLPNG